MQHEKKQGCGQDKKRIQEQVQAQKQGQAQERRQAREHGQAQGFAPQRGSGQRDEPGPKQDCCHKTKQRTEEEYKQLTNRLSRIEGQVRGIKKMVESDAYCIDILVQVAAANAALNSFNKELLAAHIRTCVADDIRAGNDETIEELVAVFQKLMK